MRKLTLLLLLGVSLGTSAQTPGGVDGSELWFKVAPLLLAIQFPLLGLVRDLHPLE